MFKYLALAIILIVLWFVFMSACAVPIVFREHGTGKDCGCLVDGEYPSMAQCSHMQRGAVYDVIWVSSCME